MCWNCIFENLECVLLFVNRFYAASALFNLESAPASCPGSFQLSWVLGTPARRECCSFSPDRFSHYWLASGRVAAHSPWCAWWGGEAARVFVRWQCLMAWLSMFAKKKETEKNINFNMNGAENRFPHRLFGGTNFIAEMTWLYQKRWMTDLYVDKTL